jgi:hypothetical protein
MPTSGTVAEQLRQQMKLKRSWLSGLISFLAVGIFSLITLWVNDEPAPILKPAPAVSPSRHVETGMHIKNIYNLSLKDKTFNADGSG